MPKLISKNNLIGQEDVAKFLYKKVRELLISRKKNCELSYHFPIYFIRKEYSGIITVEHDIKSLCED